MDLDDTTDKTAASPDTACGKRPRAASERDPGESLDAFMEKQALAGRMRRIRHKILVLSGKGGVGKSTVAANLAVSLSLAGRRVGLLDIDIHGPSIPRMLQLDGARPQIRDRAIEPVEKGGMKIMSIGFMLRGRDDAVIWRGPMKMGVIKQFLTDVNWGELDYLVIDSPPGTGDEPLSVCQLVPEADGAIVVTTPQDVATADVRKSITFCKKLNMPVIGVVENMSGMVCPHCGQTIEEFKSGGGRQMAGEMGVPFLGSIPLHPGVARLGDEGRPFSIEEGAELDPVKRAFQAIADAISEREEVHA